MSATSTQNPTDAVRRRIGTTCAVLLIALLAHGTAHADWVIPAGAVVAMPGGAAADLACADLYVAGALTVGSGASIVGARNVHIQPGGNVQLASGSTVQLAQQWDNQGSVSAAGALVSRVNSATCPAVGPVGALNPTTGQPQGGTPGVGGSVTAVPALGIGPLLGLAAALGGLGWRNRRRRQISELLTASTTTKSSR